MKPDGVDILMITHQRPIYAKMALSRLLDTCGGDEDIV